MPSLDFAGVEAARELRELQRDRDMLNWLLDEPERLQGWLWTHAAILCPINTTEANKVRKWGRAAIAAEMAGEQDQMRATDGAGVADGH